MHKQSKKWSGVQYPLKDVWCKFAHMWLSLEMWMGFCLYEIVVSKYMMLCCSRFNELKWVCSLWEENIRFHSSSGIRTIDFRVRVNMSIFGHTPIIRSLSHWLIVCFLMLTFTKFQWHFIQKLCRWCTLKQIIDGPNIFLYPRTGW